MGGWVIDSPTRGLGAYPQCRPSLFPSLLPPPLSFPHPLPQMSQLLLRRAVGVPLACLHPDPEGKPATTNIDLVGFTKFRDDNEGWLLDEVAFDPMGRLLVPLMQWAPLIDDKVIRAVDASLTALLLRSSNDGADAGASEVVGAVFPPVRVPLFSVPQSWIDGAVFADVGASVVLVSDTEAIEHWAGVAQRLGLADAVGPLGEGGAGTGIPTSVQHPSLPGVRVGVPQGHSGDPHTHVHTPPQGAGAPSSSNLLTMFVTMATTEPGSQKVPPRSCCPCCPRSLADSSHALFPPLAPHASTPLPTSLCLPCPSLPPCHPPTHANARASVSTTTHRLSSTATQ